MVALTGAALVAALAALAFAGERYESDAFDFGNAADVADGADVADESDLRRS